MSDKVKSPKIQLLDDRVLVLPQEADAITKSGIYIPDTAKEKPQRGTVVSLGDGLDDEGFKFKMNVGDNVLYGKYSGIEVELEGKTYLVLRRTDIWGILPSLVGEEGEDHVR